MFDTTFSSVMNQIVSSLVDITTNPISLTISAILGVLIIALLGAMISPTWRSALVNKKILEQDERPSSLLLWIIGVVLVVELVKGFVIQPFIVDGGSMLPTFHSKDFLLVNKTATYLGTYNRGDVAVFKLQEPGSAYGGKHLIKRIIGLPGERVTVMNGVTTIYSSAYPNGFVLEEPYVTFKDLAKVADISLGADEYFMMGDNRPQSYDSRDWGPLKEQHLRGGVLVRLFPISDFETLPGNYTHQND